jgi:HlyD family secretion protein
LARTAFFGGVNKGAKTIVTEVISNPIQSNIDNALTETRATIIKTKDVLDYTREAMSGPTLREEVTAADQTSVDTDITSINSVLTDISTAQQAISSQKITNQTNINSAENAFKKAEDDLAKIKAVPREVDIAVYKAEVDKAKASIVELQQKLGDATLKSPINGTVTKINVKIGETVTAGGSTIVSLISADKFQIEVDIPEADIGKIGLGDSAIIKLDAFPEEERSGRVLEIEPAETIIEGVTYYRVTVIFEQPDERVKSGMSVDLTIETNRKEGALFIPYRAIVYKDDKKFVRILDGNEVKEIEVEIGLKGTKGEVEIVNGLSEGEKIISFIKSR